MLLYPLRQGKKNGAYLQFINQVFAARENGAQPAGIPGKCVNAIREAVAMIRAPRTDLSAWQKGCVRRGND
jgi:hypothetical protein